MTVRITCMECGCGIEAETLADVNRIALKAAWGWDPGGGDTLLDGYRCGEHHRAYLQRRFGRRSQLGPSVTC